MSDRLGPHIKHTHRNPCDLCRKDGCVTLLDDGTILCVRMESSHRAPSGIGWLHHPEPDWRERLAATPHPGRAPQPKPPQIDPIISGRGLRAILDRCPLSPAHRDELRARGLTDHHIDALPFGSLPDDEDARNRVAAAVVEELGESAYGNVPGLHRDGGAPQLNAYPGLLVGAEQDGQLVGLTVRPNDAGVREDGKYRWLSSPGKTGGVGSGAPCGVIFPVGWNPGTPVTRVIVAEGTLKGYVISNRTGLPVIAMPGATITGDVRRLVREIGATEVLLAYDNDRTTNPNVAAGEQGLADKLRNDGFPAFRLTWPTIHKGLDDALTAGVFPMLEPITAPVAESSDDGPCSAQLADLRTRHTEVRRINQGLVNVINNQYLTAGEKVVACRAVLVMKREAARGGTDRGRVRVSPARVALDFRTGTGEERNPSGSIPIMSKSSAIGGLQRLEERGLLDVEVRPTRTRITKTNPHTGEPYTKEISVAEKWVEFVDPAAALDRIAAWRPDTLKDRKPYTRKPTCPHCGSTHLVTVCHDCGVILTDRNPTDTPAQPPESSRWKISTPISSAVERESSSRSVDTELKFSTSIAEPPVWLDEAPDPTPPDGVDAASGDTVLLTEVRSPLADADHAPDRAARRAANDKVGRLLTDIAVKRGRMPVPKPPPEPSARPAPRSYIDGEYEVWAP